MQTKTKIGLQSLNPPHRAGRVLLILFAFILPLTKLLNAYGPVMQITGVLLFSSAIFNILLNNRVVLSPAHIVAFILFLWMMISLFWANNIRIGVRVAFHYAEIFGVFWLSYYFLNDSYYKKHILFSYALGALTLSIIIFVITFVIGPESHSWALYNRRLGLRIINANTVSYILLFATVSVLFVLVKANKRRNKLALLPLLGLFLLGIVLTGTRTAIVALSLAIVPASFYLNRKYIYILFISTASIVPIALLISPDPVVRIAELFLELFSSGFSILMGSSSIETLNYRLAIWEAGFSLIKSNPLTGVGIGQFDALVDPVLSRATAPHNAFVEIFAELGIVGLSLFLLTLKMIFVVILKNMKDKQRSIAVLFIISTLVMMNATNILGSVHLWFILGVLLSDTK